MRRKLALSNIHVPEKLENFGNQYARNYQELINGLDNYRRRGYQIALNFDHLARESEAFYLIAKISPNYVSLSALNLEDQLHDGILLVKLQQLKALVNSTGGLRILQQIDDKKSDLLARNSGFDLVEGSYYRAIPFDCLGNIRPNDYEF
jgi:hypothetical protein